MTGASLIFESLDYIRRLQGQSLDLMRLGPRESPYYRIYAQPGATLRCYSEPTEHEQVLLIVPAPIKRAYIWDMAPGRSVVRQALKRGFGVYLIEWEDTDRHDLGLEDFAGDILGHCIDAIHEHIDCRHVILAGHSLGGTFAGLYSAYRPDDVAALALIEAPLHFADATGAFRSLLESPIHANAVLPHSSRVPGSLLSFLATAASPETFVADRHNDFLASLGSTDDLESHWQAVRWTLDELPVPQQLFQDVIEQLYRANDFMRGNLTFGNTNLDPQSIKAPIAAVYDPRSSITPTASVSEFCQATASKQKTLIPYHGDTGVALQHVGALIGRSAHRQLWPSIFNWLEDTLAGRLH
jgi:polyhydroxyalkanoate synthase